MESELKLLKVSINNVLELTDDLTTQQLNEIPTGSPNNLVWHLAHLLVTHKLLIYGLSNNELNLEPEFVERFRKGSKPNGDVSAEEINVIKSKIKNLSAELENDLENNLFKAYQQYPTSYNFEITNLTDAVAFNNLHFGLHVSSMLKLKKLV